MRRLLLSLIMGSTLALGPMPGDAAQAGGIDFGTHISKNCTCVYPVQRVFKMGEMIDYAAHLKRPATKPWLLLTLEHVTARGAQTKERDWLDADEGDTVLADRLTERVLRPGSYRVDIRENGKTLAAGTFSVR